MSVKLVIDMNLSPEWVAALSKQGWAALHWSTLGDPHADDAVIMGWALANSHVVFTHDLDFGTMLALTHARGPSVLQVRSRGRRQSGFYDRLGHAPHNPNPSTIAVTQSRDVRARRESAWPPSRWAPTSSGATTSAARTPGNSSAARAECGVHQKFHSLIGATL